MNLYTGCGHGCLYCYARFYVSRFDEPRLKEKIAQMLAEDLARLRSEALVELATSTDPYQPLEFRLSASRRCLELLSSSRARVLITTKSDLVLRDLDLLGKMRGRVAVAITVTTLDRRVASILEPGAPPPERRIRAIELLSREGIPSVVRIDPVIPGVNDDLDEIEALVDRAARAGALQITSSTLKAKSSLLEKLSRSFPGARAELAELYVEKGVRVRGYLYADSGWRLRVLREIKSLSEERGLVFKVCREGLPGLASTGSTCDGFGLIDLIPR
ncbi:MAG: radical SAM protein [Fervidicoccaceae archaeon]